MAVTFKPDSIGGSEDTIVLGGQTTATNGVPGPFPKYSISREPTRADNVPLNTKFTINLTGTALFDGEMLSAGSRQGEAHLKIEQILKIKDKTGVLEIAPYGGDGNIIKFPDARLTSVSADEQDDESAGVQFQNYNFTFEAYRKILPSDSLATEDSTNKLQGVVSVEESWDVSILEEFSEFKGAGEAAASPFKVWTITHNVSAVGVSTGTTYEAFSSSDDDTLADNKKAMGYINAKAWVEDRLIGNPLLNDAAVKDLQEFNMELVVPNEADSVNPYKTYNHVRTVNQDPIGGTYAVTDIWTASRSPATHTIEYSFDRPEKAEFDTVQATLNVQGLATSEATEAITYNATTQDKYANALLNFDTVKTSVHAGAATFYGVAGGAGTLKTEPVALTRSDNETLGSITYTATFNDKPQDDPDADDENLTVTLNNTDHTIDADRNVTVQGNQVVAIIPVLAKVDGPVIQDMQTTNIKTISVSYSKTMTKKWRDENKPTENINTIPSADAIVIQYKPEGGFRQNRVESWNPYNGQYNLDMDWVFNDNYAGAGGGGGGGDPEPQGGYRVRTCSGVINPATGQPEIREEVVRNPHGIVAAVDDEIQVTLSDGTSVDWQGKALCGTVILIHDVIAEGYVEGSQVTSGPYLNCNLCKNFPQP